MATQVFPCHYPDCKYHHTPPPISTQRCGKCKSVHYCNAVCQKAHWPIHKSQCLDPKSKATATMMMADAKAGVAPLTVVQLVASCPLEIKPSLITGAGRGVFVTQNVASGQDVALYDGDIHPNMAYSKIPAGRHSYCNYLPQDMILIGYPEPKTKDGVGQLINDANKPDLDSIDRKASFSDQLRHLSTLYNSYIVSRASSNVMSCKFTKEGRPVMTTIKTLKAGDELLAVYGFDFWLALVFANPAADFERAYLLKFFELMLSLVKQRCDHFVGPKMQLSKVSGNNLYEKLSASLGIADAAMGILLLRLFDRLYTQVSKAFTRDAFKIAREMEQTFVLKLDFS